MRRVRTSVWKAEDIASPAVYVRPSDTLAQAIETMNRHGFSRVPVYDGRRVTGSITGRTLRRLLANPVDPATVTVGQVQDPPLRVVAPDASLAEVLDALRDEPAVLVVTEGRPPAIVTYVDVVHDAEPYLRLNEFERMLRALLDHLDEQAPAGGWLRLLSPGHARRIREYCRRDGGSDEMDYMDLYDFTHLFRAGWQQWFRAWFHPLECDQLCQRLDAIRRVRNDVAHMRPLSGEDRRTLFEAIAEITGVLRPRLQAATSPGRGRR